MTDQNQQKALSKEQIDSVIALYSSGQYQEAIDQIKILNGLYPNVPFLFNLVGACYKELGQLEGAAKMFEAAVGIKLDYAEAHKNLGITLRDLGQKEQAIESLKKAIEIDSNYVDAYYNLAITFKDLDQVEESVQIYKKVIEINPKFAQAHNNLGNIYKGLGKNKEAIQSFEEAIKINPNFAEAFRNLGNSFRELQKREEALFCFECAKKIRPNMEFILGDILNSKMQLCFWDNLKNLLDELKHKINNSDKVIAPFPLLPLIDDPKLLRKNTEVFVNRVYPKNQILPLIESYKMRKKIRIGYFSADFRIHPVTTLTAELYEVHNRDHFEIHAFSFGPDTKDEMNLKVKAGVDHFHNVRSMSHQEITILTRSFEIDIAVDLAGFTADSAINIFAMSAAPIQLSYIGYLGTMAADYYDYLIADSVMIPKESQKYYSEKIVYLPSFQVNDSKDLPPEITLTRKEVGLPGEGFVFCCFNNTYKFTPTVFDSWARILEQVEGSVLIIFADNEIAKTNLIKEISLRGIDEYRLIFGDHLTRKEYLARYRVADLFLDTWPCNAGTTASDALKMGLPLLTLRGQSFNSREAASILTSINLPELITNTPEEYEALAIELATHPEKLKAIKEKLASNLSTTLLFDTKRFTKNLESAYTQMYERHHEGLDPDHIYV